MTIDQYKAVFHAVREALLSYSPIYGQYAVTSEEYTKVQDIAFAAADKIKSILEDMK